LNWEVRGKGPLQENYHVIANVVWQSHHAYYKQFITAMAAGPFTFVVTYGEAILSTYKKQTLTKNVTALAAIERYTTGTIRPV
jgi:hypothetical protein